MKMSREKDKKANLWLTVVFIFYIFMTTLQMGANQEVLNGDFWAHWSVGRIANNYGYAHIYDLSTLAKYQYKTNVADVVPAPYPALFILPFQIFALFPPILGVWAWRAINLFALIAYLAFLLRKFNLGKFDFYILAAIVLTLPVLINFIWAQVNVFAMIGIGEFIRLGKKGNLFASGAALGLSLIKPQLLILLGPMLLLTRNWKALTGLLASGLGIGLGSILLTGINGGSP